MSKDPLLVVRFDKKGIQPVRSMTTVITFGNKPKLE